MVIGLVSIGIRALVMPIIMITFSEFTSLLVDRTRGVGVSSKTTLLPIFGGGKML